MAQKIATFRNVQKLSQSEFAKRLGASTMAVSRWERGIQKVPANIYIRLGNWAGDPLCWYFWGCAGLRTMDVMRVLPRARQRLQEGRFPKPLWAANPPRPSIGNQRPIPSSLT